MRSIFALVGFVWTGSLAVAQLPTDVAVGTITVRTQLIASTFGPKLLDMAIPAGQPDRIFVASQTGQVLLIQNGAFSPPYLNLTSGFGLVSGSETGLLGLTFHPGFTTAASPGFGKFYTYTSESKGTNSADFFRPETGPTGGSHHNVVREWSVDPSATSVANPLTASRVLFRAANSASIHNAGAVKFGNDGYLYITLGDGFVQNDAQDLTRAFGKVFRIDPTAPNPANGRYGIPADNPFAGPGDTGLDEIYAYGLRNPFRLTIDRMTGTPYLGDVGATLREEVDRVLPGANYGWPFFEGTNERIAPPPGFVHEEPIAEYSRNWGVSVIGGFVYRGSAIPELFGQYVFADAFSSNLKLRYVDPQGGQIYGLNIAPGSQPIGNTLYGWGEDLNGELYVLTPVAQVLRIAPVPEPAASAMALALLLPRRRRR